MDKKDSLTKAQARLIQDALLEHDGLTLCPDMDWDRALELTEALNRLRIVLREIEEEAT